jgi:MoaA/NifB/PqqE/SkfB family radical SAM enzyme
MTTAAWPQGLVVEEDARGTRIEVHDGGECRRALPLARDVVPFARRLASEAAHGRRPEATRGSDGGAADFTEAAFAQLARFALQDEGALSRYVDYDRLLGPGSPPARPREVSVILTKRCNLRCLHCYNDSALRDPHELGDEEKLLLVDYLGRWGVTVLTLTGGEPTIDPTFAGVLALARQHRMGVKISTNAWHLPAALLEGLRTGTVIQLSISLDGADAATHDHLRQRRGSFDRVVASLRLLEECRPRTVVLNAGIHLGSLQQMEVIAGLAAAGPVDVVAFKPITFTGRPGGDASFVLGHAELAEFARIRDQLRREYAGRLVVDGKLTGDDVQPELQEDLSCQAAQTAMVVHADGRLLPCDTLAGVPDAPNVRDVAPMTAWLGDPVFGAFREIRDRSSGGCGTSGCPGHAASAAISASRRGVVAAPVFVPLQQLRTRA